MADLKLPADMADDYEIVETHAGTDDGWLNDYHERDVPAGEVLVVTDGGYVVARKKP